MTALPSFLPGTDADMTTNRSFLRRPLSLDRVICRLLCAFALFGAVGTTGCVNAIDTMTAGEAVQPASVEVSSRDQECLARAMYFESNRSSETGMLAVGTVVMNRVASERYPNSVCDVVGQRNQFAPGVMSRAMSAGKELAMNVARDVLGGKRHKDVKTAMYFHTAGMRFGYRNMNYVAVAGGNAFYQRVQRGYRDMRMASQRDVLVAQRRAESNGRSYVTTASAMMPKERESHTGSPFQALWRGLTSPKAQADEVAVASAAPARPVASASTDAARPLAAKGARPIRGGKAESAVAAPSAAPAQVDEAALEDRMGGLPGVATDLGSMMSQDRNGDENSAGGFQNAFAGN